MTKDELIIIKGLIREAMEINNIKTSDLSKVIGLKEGTVKSYIYGSKPISYDFLSIFIKTKLLGKEKREYVETILKNSEKKIEEKESKKYTGIKNKKNDKDYDFILIKEIIDLKRQMEILEAKNNLLESINKIENMEYKENRRVNAFTSDLQTRTLISRQLLDLNTEISKRWGELKLLLDINNPNDNIKIQKGLNTIGDKLLEIGKEIKIKALREKSLNEEIIDL